MQTAPAEVFRAILATLSARGVATASFLDRVGVEPRALQGRDARIPLTVLARAWNEAARVSGDEAFGLHFGETVPVGAFPVVDFVTRACATVGEGLERLVAHQRILFDDEFLAIESTDAFTRLTVHLTTPPGLEVRQIAEAALSTYLERARSFSGERLIPVAVSFAHAAPRSTAEHERLFGVDVAFDAPATQLCFSREDAMRPLLGADSGLRSLLEQHAQEVLRQLPTPSSTRMAVKQAIADNLDGRAPTATAVAEQLGMSARTLRRKLAEEGSTFSEALAEVRCELASKLLVSDELSITDIAFVLGYSETSAFHRAFRTWTSKTPKQWREGER